MPWNPFELFWKFTACSPRVFTATLAALPPLAEFATCREEVIFVEEVPVLTRSAVDALFANRLAELKLFLSLMTIRFPLNTRLLSS